MSEVIKACVDLEKHFGSEPFDQALPKLQAGWATAHICLSAKGLS